MAPALALLAVALALASGAAHAQQPTPTPAVVQPSHVVDWTSVASTVSSAVAVTLTVLGGGGGAVALARRRAAAAAVTDEESVEAVAAPRTRTAGEILAAIDERTARTDKEVGKLRRTSHEHAKWLTVIASRLEIDELPRPPGPLRDGEDDSDSDKPDT